MSKCIILNLTELGVGYVATLTIGWNNVEVNYDPQLIVSFATALMLQLKINLVITNAIAFERVLV